MFANFAKFANFDGNPNAVRPAPRPASHVADELGATSVAGTSIGRNTR
jgi:hypothetical protein